MKSIAKSSKDGQRRLGKAAFQAAVAVGATVWALSTPSLAAERIICLESEQFAERGGWAVDSQFIDQMGSSCLLAHGMGKPVSDAVTTFECPEAGAYQVWARTRNWTTPWSEHAAGTFTVKVDGK